MKDYEIPTNTIDIDNLTDDQKLDFYYNTLQYNKEYIEKLNKQIKELESINKYLITKIADLENLDISEIDQ